MITLTIAVASATAQAEVICVPEMASGCTSFQTTFPAAVNAANTAAGEDTIQLAPGHFAVATGVSALAPVHIVGAGMDHTVIDGTSTAGTYTLTVSGADSTVTDLTVHGTATGHDTALYLDGATAQRVRVDQRDNSGDPYATGAQVRNGASFLDGEALTRPDSSGGLPEGLLVDAGLGQTSRVENSVVQGWDALYTSGAGTTIVSRCRAVGTGHTVYAYDGANTTIEDSTLKGAPATASGQGTSNVSLTLRHDTLDTARVEARGDFGNAAHVVVSNTALVGGGSEFTQFYLGTGGGGPARVDVDYSFYAGADHVDQSQYPGPTNVFGDGGHNVIGSDAKLLDVAAGDLRPRWDSPLVDAGDPVAAAGEPASDLGGGDRNVNGRTDIGAYEYGRHAPTVSAGASSRTAFTGDAVTFTAYPTDADPYEVANVTWQFDDGATASGSPVSHAFSTPGSHVAKVTATDPAGLTGTAVTSVTVSSPPFPRRTMAPTFGFTSLKARKGVVPVVLRCPVIANDCAGTVELRLGRKLLGRARYAIVHGTKKTVRVKLTKSARDRLSKARRGLHIKVLAKPTGAASKSKTVRLTGR
jgi:hypothetical protein